MSSNCLVCHYSEISLKGKNRKFFERHLIEGIRRSLPGVIVSSPHGRVVVESSDGDVVERLKKIPGIEYFFVADRVNSDKEEILEKATELMSREEFSSFRVTVKRNDKDFPVGSMEMASLVGALVAKESGKKVDLKNYDVNCFVEINKGVSYIYFKKIKGVGGLPVGSGGKMAVMLSGGIDSPVASFRVIRRGAKCIFVHFHAYPTTTRQSIEKVTRIVSKLTQYQGRSVLYLVPFDAVQKQIMINTKEETRVLLYRRFMMRITEEIMKLEKAKAIVTGESLGQVASQTVENMTVTQEAVNSLVFRPLIGYDKEEIIREAKSIGTYEISILPEDDCCVRFLPKRPVIRGRVSDVLEQEKQLSVEEIVQQAVDQLERKVITT